MHEHMCKKSLTIKTLDTVFSKLRDNHYLCTILCTYLIWYYGQSIILLKSTQGVIMYCNIKRSIATVYSNLRNQHLDLVFRFL